MLPAYLFPVGWRFLFCGLPSMPFIFLSYSHKDGEYANRLADSLEAKGLEVWIDERIDYGAHWPKVIQENLDRCAAFIVVMTPDSFESEWVQAELTRAQRLRKPTFPLLLDGDIWLALEATQYVDVRGAKLPPSGFFTRLAAVLSAGQAQGPVASSQRERLLTELDELQRRFDNLTSRIRAVDTDLGRVMDSEHRLTLEERRAELAASREKATVRMAEIEALLGQIAEHEVPPVQAQESKSATKPPIPPIRTQALPSTKPAPVTPLAGDLVTIDKPIRLELIRIPAGKFPMGEGTEVHLVDVAEFWIGKYPVTNAQYAAFVKATGYRTPSHWTEGKIPPNMEEHPVVCVSWRGAEAFCQWLSEATDKPFRLPSEAEWEKAASWDAAQRWKRKYPWGDEFDRSKCNAIPFARSYKRSTRSSIDRMTPVGKYSPYGDSPYGVADMAGYVWEWTSSLHKPYPYNPEDGREDLNAPGKRVVRGGSWPYVDRDVATSSSRLGANPVDRYDYYGVRVVVGVHLP